MDNVLNRHFDKGQDLFGIVEITHVSSLHMIAHNNEVPTYRLNANVSTAP